MAWFKKKRLIKDKTTVSGKTKHDEEIATPAFSVKIKQIREIEHQRTDSAKILTNGRAALFGGGYGCEVIDLLTGKQILEIKFKKLEVRCVSVSMDGRFGLAGGRTTDLHGDAPSLVFFDLASGEILDSFLGHETGEYLPERRVDAVDMSSNGRFLISAGAPSQLMVWDTQTGRRIRTIETKFSNTVAMTPDGKLAVSGGYCDSGNACLSLWNLADSTEKTRYIGDEYRVNDVAISPYGQQLLTGGFGSTARLWDLESAGITHLLDCQAADIINHVAITKNGDIGITASSDKIIRLWCLRTGQCLYKSEAQEGSIHFLSSSLDGVYFVSRDGVKDKTRIWELEWIEEASEAFSKQSNQQYPKTVSNTSVSPHKTLSLEKRKTLQGHTESIVDVDITPDGQRIVSVGEYGEIMFWDSETGNCRERKKLKGLYPKTISIAPDGKKAVMAGKKFLKVFDVWSGKDILDLGDQDLYEYKTSIAATTPDNLIAVSATENVGVKIWNISSGKCLKTFEDVYLTNDLRRIIVTPDQRYVLISHGKVLVVDLKTGQEKCYLSSRPNAPGIPESTYGISIGSNGRYAGFIQGKDISVWDLKTFECMKCFERAQPDREYKTGPGYEKMQVWKNGLDVPNEFLYDIQLINKDRYALLASESGELYIFDMISGDHIHNYKAHSSWITSIACTPDERHVVTGSHDQSLQVWKLNFA